MDRRPEAPWFAAQLTLACLVLAFGAFDVHNLDIGLHAATGRWIVEHGEVPTTNVLSEIHADYPSVHDKWLFQVLAHGLLDGLGPGAVVLARLAVLGLLVGLVTRLARRLGASPWSTVGLVVLMLLAARSRLLFRPDLLSLTLLVAVLSLALGRRPGPGRMAALMGLQVLWVNLHGYFLLGWLTVALVGTGRVAEGWLAGRGAARALAAGAPTLALSLAMALACLLNPAGLAGAGHPFAILADLFAHEDFYRVSIEEFAPTFASGALTVDRLAFLVMLVAAAVVLIGVVRGVLRGPGTAGGPAGDPEADDAPSTPGLLEHGLPLVVVVVVFAVMSRELRRNMAPFAVVAAPVVAAGLTLGLARLRLPRWVGASSALVLALPAMACEVADVTSVHLRSERRFGFGLSSLAYPDTGIEAVAAWLPDKRVFTAFRYGSTFTGRRWPEQVAATNGNTHGYPTAWLQDVMAATAGTDLLAFHRICRQHDLDVALLPAVAPLSARLMGDDDWTLVCLGRREVVFVRDAAVEASWLDRHDLERRLADPGARVTWPTPVHEAPAAIRPGEGPPGGFAMDLRTDGDEARWPWPSAVEPRAELDVGTFLLVTGHAARAEVLARRALALAPGRPEAQGLLGLCLLAGGRRDEARPLLQASLEGGGHALVDVIERSLPAGGP